MSHCNLPSGPVGPHGYSPISCGYYDRLEAFATLKTEVSLAYTQPESENLISIKGRVIDLFSREQAEYLLFQSGETRHEVRLDRVYEIDGITNPSFVSSMPQ